MEEQDGDLGWAAGGVKSTPTGAGKAEGSVAKPRKMRQAASADDPDW